MKPNEGIDTRLVLLLSVMAGISVANLYYCQPLLDMIRQDMELSQVEVNCMPVCTQIGYALGLMLIIPMGDIYNRRTTILSCFLMVMFSLLMISSAGYYSIPFAERHSAFIVLLLGSFITGVFSVAPQIFIPFVSQFAKPAHKARKAGYVLSGLLCGILVSRVLSGYVGYLWGWRMMYVIASGVMLFSSLIIYFVFPYVEPTFRGRYTTLLKSLFTLCVRHPRSIHYSVRSALTFGSMMGMWACMAFRMKEAPYYGGSELVGLLGLCGVAGALTASNVGRFIPRLGVDRINYVGVSLVLLAWLVLYLFDHHIIGLIIGVIVIDIGMQCVQLSNQTANIELRPDAPSRMNTIFMVTYFTGGSLGTLLAGILWSKYGWTGTVLAGLLLLFISYSCSMLYDERTRN